MKTKFFLLLVLISLIGFYSVGSTKRKSDLSLKSNSPIILETDSCYLKSKVPHNLEDLSILTRLNLNLSDNCNFQPIHYQVRSGYPSTEVIVRITGKKTTSRNFALTRMELKHFEVSNNPQLVIVDTAFFAGVKNGKQVIKLKLINLDDEFCENCAERKRKFLNDGIDFIIKNNPPLIIENGTIIDTEISNELDIYPLFGLRQYDVVNRPIGRHCNTLVQIW